jgi:hypothetical protein
MKESHDEGVASHIGPESCGGVSNGAAEALTGVRAGRVWSREDPKVQGADAVLRVEGNTERIDSARFVSTLRGQRPRARTETLYAGTGRSHGCLWRVSEAASGSLRTHADDERSWEVGQPNSTKEASEQGASCGGGGGKEVGQGEPA